MLSRRFATWANAWQPRSRHTCGRAHHGTGTANASTNSPVPRPRCSTKGLRVRPAWLRVRLPCVREWVACLRLDVTYQLAETAKRNEETLPRDRLRVGRHAAEPDEPQHAPENMAGNPIEWQRAEAVEPEPEGEVVARDPRRGEEQQVGARDLAETVTGGACFFTPPPIPQVWALGRLKHHMGAWNTRCCTVCNTLRVTGCSKRDSSRCSGSRCSGSKCSGSRCSGSRCDGSRCDGSRCDGSAPR